MPRKRKPDCHREPSPPTTDKSPSSRTHPLPRSTKKKKEHRPSPTTGLVKPERVHSSHVARSTYTERPQTTKRPTKKPSSFTSLRSSPAFSNMAYSCSVRLVEKPQRSPHLDNVDKESTIDLISLPHSDARSQKQPNAHQSKRAGKIGARRSPDRLPWRNGDPTCSPPRTITFGPPLPSSNSDSTDHFTYHPDPIELYHRIETQLESIDSRLDTMERTLSKLQRTQKFILNDAMETPQRQDERNHTQQLRQLSNLLLKVYAATNRIECRYEQATSPPSQNHPHDPPK